MVAGSGVDVAPSPMDWLPEGHLVYFLMDVTGEIDLSPIFAHYEKIPQGVDRT